MKQETKELIDWIKKQINLAKDCCINLAWEGKHEQYNKDHKKAFEFLDSLPKIESRLCHGGYIQDKNGTPCCHGDIVKFEFEDKTYEENWKRKYQKVIRGRLEFSVDTKDFVILFGKDNNGYDWIDWTTSDYGCKWFEKVEK